MSKRSGAVVTTSTDQSRAKSMKPRSTSVWMAERLAATSCHALLLSGGHEPFKHFDAIEALG
jgi:hypothetical protein